MILNQAAAEAQGCSSTVSWPWSLVVAVAKTILEMVAGVRRVRADPVVVHSPVRLDLVAMAAAVVAT